MRADQANAEEEANGSANAGKLNADGTPIEGQAAFWTEQAATCVLQSIKHSPKDHGKRVVKIIHALGFSKHPVAVGRALQRHVDAIPLWVWIDWIPQLLLVLLRPEAPHAKAVLTRLASRAPASGILPIANVLARTTRRFGAKNANVQSTRKYSCS